MGIPAFYQWLIERCPLAQAKVLEAGKHPDITDPNPNGFEFDNLYLDMNGIIHPCFHPQDWPAPKSYEKVFATVVMYIDRIFSLIRPRKLLYMAIDGVAPRAKMNQQRARRFKAAIEASGAFVSKKRRVGNTGKDKSLEQELFDSNLITPGTGFMELLSSALQYYVHFRMNNDPGWKGIKVILSDATVPGEGEHKIMSYIRLQRNLPGFDPNTRHCLYGLDADLIMLALATHEIHFSVLRECPRRKPLNAIRNIKRSRRSPNWVIRKQQFQFLHIWIIREYLAESLRIPNPAVQVDLERLVDDFVFMCLFVGNDFLPHVPSLEISEGAIDLLMVVYRREFVRMGGYLTDASKVNLERVEHFVQALGTYEKAIFKRRKQKSKSRKKKDNRLRSRSKLHELSNVRFVADKVNLGEDGWKERYYTEKFQIQTDDDLERVIKHAVSKYVEGICWVMHYYYEGVCSWKWFYPHHYSPFASDFRGLNQLKVGFVLGKPFKPLDQLMSVLPAASAGALPLLYRNLMTDPSSPILDFYPTEFELDLNGRIQHWKAVCRLPFIDEDRLLTEIAKLENTLTDAERRRNTLGLDRLFINMSHPLAAKIFTFWQRNQDNPKIHKAKVKKKVDPKLSGGMNGYIYISDTPACPTNIPSPLPSTETIFKNKVLVVLYKYPPLHPHIPRPPEGVKMPPKTVGKQDLLPPPSLWHEDAAVNQSSLTSSPIPAEPIAGSCLAQPSLPVTETCSSEDHGILGKSIHDALLGPIPPEPIEGPCLAQPLPLPIIETCTIEDHGILGKRSHDALDKAEKERKKRAKRRKTKRNVLEGDGILGKSSHDALSSPVPPQPIAGSCLAQPSVPVTETYRSEDHGMLGKSSHDALLSPIPPEPVAGPFLAQPSLPVTETCRSEDHVILGTSSHDALLSPIPPEPIAGPCLAQPSPLPIIETCSSEDHGILEKGSQDALEKAEKKREKRARRKKTKRNVIEGDGIIGKSSHNALLSPIPPEPIAGPCLAQPSPLPIIETCSSEDHAILGKRSRALAKAEMKRQKRARRKKRKETERNVLEGDKLNSALPHCESAA